MKISYLQNPGLLLLLGCLFFQTHVLLGSTPASVEQDINATPQAEQIVAAGVGPGTLSIRTLSLSVLGIGAVCFALSLCFAAKRAPQPHAQAPLARPTTSSPLSQDVPRRWSEDIVPLKLK